ncbi:MAG: prolipoprotein diacylglyceryl transferase [Cyclobacteriaceae bacterium]|nr:prolipoprotein diacylglyceryl transferase [Cyclobacteriaceae bacterium]
MYPVLFRAGPFTVYSYGFLIAIGAFAGVAYLYYRGRKEVGLTYEQVNNLFLLLFAAAFIGGKLLLFFEGPSYYLRNPGKLVTGSGFVFYGSFLLAVPAMLWFFRKNKLPVYPMLDIMAGVTCLVHAFGRLGCFMAGCCYGKPTTLFLGVTFTNPSCQARPLNTPLFPTQLAEALYIAGVFVVLQLMLRHRTFYGQLFLIYLVLYAGGRFALEYFRGDAGRGFIIDGYLSHAQLIAMLFAAAALYLYPRWKKRNAITSIKRPRV